MESKIILTLVFVVTAFSIYFCASGVSKLLEDYKVVQPEPGIKCIIVSRAMHTSVDCWREQ
jgi:hypothetical protein